MPNEYEYRERIHNELARRLEQERRALKDAPVIVAITNAVMRCHFCGVVTTHLFEVETLGANHEGAEKGHQRLGCGSCHPESRKELWKMRGEYSE